MLSSSTFTRGSPKTPNCRAPRVGDHELTHLLRSQAAGPRHPVHLVLSRRRADVGIETAPRRCDQVHGHWAVSPGRRPEGPRCAPGPRSGEPGWWARGSSRRMQPRCTGMGWWRRACDQKYLGVGERLPDQRGTDGLPLLLDQGAACLAREQPACDAGHDQRDRRHRR